MKNINKAVCEEGGNKHSCYEIGKIDSALHTAFYPGDPPFQHGGIARVAGAVAFYITKAHAFFDGNKRTAFLSAALFLRLNDLVLLYPPDSLANLIEGCAAGDIDIDEVKGWYEIHKIYLPS